MIQWDGPWCVWVVIRAIARAGISVCLNSFQSCTFQLEQTCGRPPWMQPPRTPSRTTGNTACRKRHVAPQFGWTLYRHHPRSQPPNATKRFELLFAPQQSVGDWSWSVLLIFLAPRAWGNLAVPKQGMAIYQLSSFRLIACEFIMACFCMLRFLRSWCWSMHFENHNHALTYTHSLTHSLTHSHTVDFWKWTAMTMWLYMPGRIPESIILDKQVKPGPNH